MANKLHGKQIVHAEANWNEEKGTWEVTMTHYDIFKTLDEDKMCVSTHHGKAEVAVCDEWVIPMAVELMLTGSVNDLDTDDGETAKMVDSSFMQET